MPAPTPRTPRALPRASPPGTLEIEPRTSTEGVTVNAPRTVKTKAAHPAATPKAAVVAVAAEKLSIPATIELATGKLGALHKLLTATAWEKAAIVFAFTYVGTNQHDAGRGNSLGLTEFAKLGIAGLKDKAEVSRWRKMWAEGSGDQDI